MVSSIPQQVVIEFNKNKQKKKLEPNMREIEKAKKIGLKNIKDLNMKKKEFLIIQNLMSHLIVTIYQIMNVTPLDLYE